MEPDLPFEFLIPGTPLSLQTSPVSKEHWKTKVAACAREALPAGSWLVTDALAVTIFIFPDNLLSGDVDNRVKPILDGMSKCVYCDDAAIERVVVQKFEPGRIFRFSNPSPVLEDALNARKPVTYVRVSNDLHEDLS